VANAKLGKSDYDRTSAGTRGNAEDAPLAAIPIEPIADSEQHLLLRRARFGMLSV
jgi:hypothetical protein